MDEKTREEQLDVQLRIVRRDRSTWRLRAQHLQEENDKLRAIISEIRTVAVRVLDV